MLTRRARIATIACLALGCTALWSLRAAPPAGCDAYIPAPGPLIAHAGGGLPGRTYANDAEALDRAATHGFRLIELDFMVRDGRLTIGHDGLPESSLTVPALMAWLDAHPDVAIVTDLKTANLPGLTLLKQAAGRRIGRFIPQIYHPDEYAPVTALGYPVPILTVYRLGDSGWQQAANALPLRAVTMPYDRRHLAGAVHHPVFLHTVNHPVAGFGLYTDCLIPA